MKFDDVGRAILVLGTDYNLNQCSGKWNFGYYDDQVKLAVENLRHNLDRIALPG